MVTPRFFRQYPEINITLLIVESFSEYLCYHLWNIYEHYPSFCHATAMLSGINNTCLISYTTCSIVTSNFSYILGPADYFPAYGPNSNSWSPSPVGGSSHFIEVWILHHIFMSVPPARGKEEYSPRNWKCRNWFYFSGVYKMKSFLENRIKTG